MFITALATAAVWWVLSMLSQWVHAPAAGRFYAASFMWTFPALTLGLFLSAIIIPPVFKRLLGQRYPELEAYGNAVAGEKQIKAYNWLFGILPVAAMIMVVQIWNFHAFFGDRRIEIRELTDISTHAYLYSDVADIVTSLYTTAPNGDLVYGRDYQVEFGDGRKWGTHSNGYGLSDPQKQQIVLYVSNKSGKAIREVKALP